LKQKSSPKSVSASKLKTGAAAITLAASLLNCLAIVIQAPALAANDTRSLRYAPAQPQGGFQNTTMDPKNVPDFPANMQVPPQNTGAAQASTGGQPTADAADGTSTSLKADAASTTLPVQTRLKLVLETPVDAKTSQPGNIFEAHVKDDLFVGTTLLLPGGSIVRGRVFEVTKPRLLSRAAKIGLKLEQIVTPTGEVIPLDAALEFQKGLTNQRGQFDPGTSFGTRVEGNLKSVTGMNSTGTARGALIAANVATLGAPAIATAIGGSAIAIFRSGDNVSLGVGQELEVLLTNDLGLQLN
jgi:hypothetical protein